MHAVNGLAILWVSYSLAHGRARAVVFTEERLFNTAAAD